MYWRWKDLKGAILCHADKMVGEPGVFRSALELVDFDCAHRAEIESAVEVFIATERWPELSPEMRAVLHVRLRMAACFPRGILGAGKEAWLGRRLGRLDNAALWRWLLITSWNEFGCDLFHEADDLAGKLGG
jgi:hypothetical protein